MKFKNRLLKIPYGLSSIALGLGTLGNAWNSFANNKTAFNVNLSFNASWVPFLTVLLSGIFILFILARVLVHPSDYVKHSTNIKTASHVPVIGLVIMSFAGIFDNISIGSFSTYHFGITPWLGSFAILLWWIGVIIQFAHMILYAVLFIKKGKLSDIDASLYVVVVGPAVATVLDHAGHIYSNFAGLVHFFWYIALIGALIAFLLMTYRYLFVQPAADFSSFGIYSSAMPLLFVTRLVAFDHQAIVDSHGFWLFLLFALGTVTTLIVYISMFKIWRTLFKQHFASFAFSLITQAFGSILFAQLFAPSSAFHFGTLDSHYAVELFIWIGFIELLISTVVFCFLIKGYVIITYYWLFSKQKTTFKNPILKYFLYYEVADLGKQLPKQNSNKKIAN